MGDIADYMVDRMIEQAIDEEFDGDDGSVTCNRCGEEGLEWVYTGERWRLIDAVGAFHVCKNDSAIDNFEVLE